MIEPETENRSIDISIRKCFHVYMIFQLRESPTDMISQLIQTISTSLGIDHISESILPKKNIKVKHKKSNKRNDKGDGDNEGDEEEDYVAIEGSSIYPKCSGSIGHVCDNDGDEICK